MGEPLALDLNSGRSMVRHLRRRSGFPAVFWLFSAHLLAGPECRTHAEGVTGNIVFAGDSLTAGIGAAPQMSYPAQCLTILDRGWTGHNSGVSGQTGRQIIEDYDAQIGRHCDRSKPLNVLVLWEATDDLASGAPPEEVAENLARICARARATGFDRVILLTSTPRSNFPGTSAIPGTPEQQRRTYNRRRDAVDARLMALYPTVDAVVPLHSDGQIGVDGAELNPVYFAGDRVHMNDRGYFVVAALVAERIRTFGPRRIIPGRSWPSPRGHHHLVLQGDGNLVLYGPQRRALWASGTEGQPAAEAVMQPDGNLFVNGTRRGNRVGTGKALWASGTNGLVGADLRVQDDGNVVIYHKGRAAWSTGTGTWTRPRNYSPPAPPTTWKEHWGGPTGIHDQLVKLSRYNDDVAVYFDRDMPREDAEWLLPITTRIWQYTKKTYGDFGGPDDRLFAIFHKGRYGGGHPSTYFDSHHDDRNVTDIGLDAWDPSKVGYIIHEVGHIVEGASNGVLGSPAYGHGIWGDSKWAEFFEYDLRVGIGQVKEAEDALRRFTAAVDNFPRPKTRWFRDFFHPLWRDHGHAQVMVNYFRLISKHYPKETLEDGKGLKFSRGKMNWGEYIHFMSGAAGKDLRPLATRAFGWPAGWESQFQKARAEFPGVLYPE
ncbi:MAG TPA: GDSL-type esterase/lipase family protein [Isosphaeraceae bacterium]|nr:GDSL-type esterase/lipase family protein [Isosphaeraceae bacterium]